MSAKALPQKLEDELNAQKYYKVSNENVMNSQVANVGRRRSIPASVQGVFNDSVERSMYDEIFGHMLPTQRYSQQSTLAVGSAVEALRKGGCSEETNSDFTTNLLKRLRILEKEAKESRERLAAEVVKNEKLTEEIERLKRSSEEPGYLLKQLNTTRHENKDLQRKLQEMEEFLADYGLIWVGRDDTQATQTQSEQVTESDKTTPVIPPISFSAFAKAITELNSIIYAEPAQVMTDNDTHRKARLVQAAERVTRIRLAFYHNGLMIQNGPFRTLTSDSYRIFTKDILDGYFPSEFRDQFPDGVLFDLIDHHQDMYSESSGTSTEGQISAKQFLNRLPKNVVHQGNIVSVRGDIEQRLTPSDTTSALSDINNNKGAANAKKTPVVMQTIAQRSLNNSKNKEDAEQDEEQQHHSLGSIVKVHIQWIDRSTLAAAMFETSTVSDLRAEFARHFAVAGEDMVVAADSVELRSAYPSKLLFDGMTMREAGLAPNGTVHARKLA